MPPSPASAPAARWWIPPVAPRRPHRRRAGCTAGHCASRQTASTAGSGWAWLPIGTARGWMRSSGPGMARDPLVSCALSPRSQAPGGMREWVAIVAGWHCVPFPTGRSRGVRRAFSQHAPLHDRIALGTRRGGLLRMQRDRVQATAAGMPQVPPLRWGGFGVLPCLPADEAFRPFPALLGCVDRPRGVCPPAWTIFAVPRDPGSSNLRCPLVWHDPSVIPLPAAFAGAMRCGCMPSNIGACAI